MDDRFGIFKPTLNLGAYAHKKTPFPATGPGRSETGGVDGYTRDVGLLPIVKLRPGEIPGKMGRTKDQGGSKVKRADPETNDAKAAKPVYGKNDAPRTGLSLQECSESSV